MPVARACLERLITTEVWFKHRTQLNYVVSQQLNFNVTLIGQLMAMEPAGPRKHYCGMVN